MKKKGRHHLITNDEPRDATRVSTSTSFLTFVLTVPDVPRVGRLLLGLFRVARTSHRLYFVVIAGPRLFPFMYALSG